MGIIKGYLIGKVKILPYLTTPIQIQVDDQKQIPFGNDRQEKQRQRQKQVLRCAQDDNYAGG